MNDLPQNVYNNLATTETEHQERENARRHARYQEYRRVIKNLEDLRRSVIEYVKAVRTFESNAISQKMIYDTIFDVFSAFIEDNFSSDLESQKLYGVWELDRTLVHATNVENFFRYIYYANQGDIVEKMEMLFQVIEILHQQTHVKTYFSRFVTVTLQDKQKCEELLYQLRGLSESTEG